MGFRIVVAGESQCESFAECCLVADFLSQNLPDFCYDRIEIAVADWKSWLSKVNQKNRWHHLGSPIIWKEMLMAGSKPYYIGSASQFLDYCYSYYDFDSFFACDKYENLTKNILQYKKKLSEEKHNHFKEAKRAPGPDKTKNDYIITISGASNELTMYLLSGLLEMNFDNQNTISKIYIHDDNWSEEFMSSVEKQLAYIETIHADKVVKYAPKIGMALTSSKLLIVLNHVPFRNDMSIGGWLHANGLIMDKLSLMINASASRSMHIVFPNVGPACYNATRLKGKVSILSDHIVVATSDLGMEVLSIAAEIANVPSKNIFCPPVWGFVGINHLVDLRTTIHRYDTFTPYSRYTKVKNSTLKIGSVTPELRTMEYLMYFDETLWCKVAETKKKYPKGQPWVNKAIAVLNLVKLWLFKPNPENIINLGLPCNGSFGLNFNGIFSQPARLTNDEWTPASEFLTPKDANVNIYYLQDMAERIMALSKNDLPPLVPFYPCACKPKVLKKKEIWYNKKIKTLDDIALKKKINTKDTI